MIKSWKIKVRSVENEESIMEITMKKIIIRTTPVTIFIITVMIKRIKIGNRMKMWSLWIK